MNKYIVASIVAFIALGAFGAWRFLSSLDTDGAKDADIAKLPQSGRIVDVGRDKIRVSDSENIRITYPVVYEDDMVQIPALVEGGARPVDAALEITIFDADQNKIGGKLFAPSENPETNAEGFGIFSVRVPYDLPRTKQGFIQMRTLDSITDDELDILFYPILFTADPAFANVYFTSESADACTAVAVERHMVQSDVKIGRLLNELIAGPTEKEREAGYGTAFTGGTRMNYWNLDGQTGELHIDFSEELRGIAGSCTVQAAYMQLEKTVVDQFDEVKSLRLTINEDEEDVLEP